MVKKPRKKRIEAEKFEHEGIKYEFSLPWNSDALNEKFDFVQKHTFLDEEAWEDMNADEDLSEYKIEKEIDDEY